MILPPPFDPPDESYPADSSIHFEPPRSLVEDYWDWESALGGPYVSVFSARLIAPLRAVAARRSARRALLDSAIARVRAARSGEAEGLAITMSNALADLAVSGRSAFQDFQRLAPTEDRLLGAMMEEGGAAVPGLTEAEARRALEGTLDRAYAVVWALTGPPAYRREARPALGWIAVSGEDDAPHSPVNVSVTDDPMGEIHFADLGQAVSCRVSLKILDEVPALPGPSGRSFPIEARQQFDDLLGSDRSHHYEELILFVHGLGQRLEEGDRFKRKLLEHGRAKGKRYAVLSIDLPGFGYSSRLDFDAVVQGCPARFDLGDPLRGSSFPFLDLYRSCLAQLANRIEGGIQYAVGGSLGGNLVLRLAEIGSDGRFLPPDSLKKLVSWSPASIWESYERARWVPVKPGTHFDLAKHETVRHSRDQMNELENPERRHAFFDWIQRGTEVLEIFRVDGWVSKGGATKDALLNLAEVYGGEWRRTFWAVSHEQTIFSHQEPLAPGQTWPFRTIDRPLLILAGEQDGAGGVGDLNPFDYYNNVEKVARESPSVPGYRMLLRRTGHSIHEERPDLLASLAVELFTDGLQRGIQLFALGGDGAVYGRWQREPNGRWNDGGWLSLGGAGVRQIAVERNADGRVEVFALREDGTVSNAWQREATRSWDPDNWGSLGGRDVRQIAAGANADGRLEVFALGGDGAVYNRWQVAPNGGWNGEGWASLGGRDVRQITVGANADGRLMLFAVGGDGVVYGRWQRRANEGWNADGWGSLGGREVRQVAVGASADGRLMLFALGADGAVYHRWQRRANEGWNVDGWGSLGGRDVRRIAVGANADGRLELFALGGDGTVYHRWQRRPNEGWNEGGWGSMGGTGVLQIAAASNADGRLEVFALGGDRAVYNRWQVEPNGRWNEAGWSSLGGRDVRQIVG